MADTKALLTRYYNEVWGAGNIDTLAELLADDYVDRNPSPGFGSDKASTLTLVGAITAGMKDIKVDVPGMVVEGDSAAAHWNMQWTQVGDLMGRIPADGKRILMHGHDFYRIRDGKITDIWHCEDFFGVMAQLGLIPGV